MKIHVIPIRPSASLATLWIASLIALFVVSLKLSGMKGDGLDYYLYTEAFVRHATPDIRKAEFESSKQLEYPPQTSYESLGRGMGFRGETEVGSRGFYRSPGGGVYNYHFWLYPLLVAPVLWVVEAAGKPPFTAFSIVNFVFLIAALGYVWLCWRGESIQKHYLTGMMLFCGTPYYLAWPHPEVYTSCLLLLSLLALSDRRYVGASILSGLAAAQNPPIAALVVLIAATGLWHMRTNAQSPSLMQNPVTFRRISGGFIAGLLIAALPMAFFKATFGAPSAIAALGYADPSLVSAGRVMSIFLDLNLGMLPNLPGLAVTLLAIPLLALTSRKKRDHGALACLCVLAAGCAVSAGMAVGSTATINWNHGATVMSRYAYWLAVPLIFASALCLSWLSKPGHHCRPGTGGWMSVRLRRIQHVSCESQRGELHNV